MDPKSNPFLMDDYPAEADAAISAASNPFLQDFGDASAIPASVGGAEANPFFSFAPDPSYQPPTDSTNPFASFGVEAAAVPEQETNVFIAPEVASVPEQEPEPLISVEATAEMTIEATTVTAPEVEVPQQSTPCVPSKPARPPPPPRPGPPPPPARNPKELILSVTGAMDETSNEMLDRLQATRTPSPSLMHSPSPTPEHSVAEMLDVDGRVPELSRDTSSQDILGLYDTPAAPLEASVQPDVEHNEAVVRRDSSTPSSKQISDNPFSDVSQTQVQHLEGSAAQTKRPSLTSGSPVAAQPTVPKASEQVAAVDPVQSEEAIDVSSHYNTTQPTEQPSVPPGGGFADLLGGFGSVEPIPDTTYNSSVSPAAAQEYPHSAYPATDTSGGFAAAVDHETGDAFDAFASKFEKAAEHDNTSNAFGDPFGGGSGHIAMDTSSDVWGDSSGVSTGEPISGFGEDTDGFDSFLSMTAPPPDITPKRRGSGDSDEAPDFSVYIKPKDGDEAYVPGGPVPTLAPPPKSPMHVAYADSAPHLNPFDASVGQQGVPTDLGGAIPGEMKRSDSQETPPTPLFDEDVSQPLEDFPRITYTGEGWEMQLRMPIKKKITGQRFWKKIFVKLVYQGDNPVLQLFNSKGDKDPFQELPLLACYSVSEIAAQQFDQYGKIFTVKLQYIFYKERPGVRPGQVTKAERITNKLSQFAAYAIQGDYQGVKEFGSDLKKLGMPVEHAPQISQLFKLGSQNYEDMKQFSVVIEEALFRLSAHRDRALQYKMEEVQINVVDEIYVEQNADGHVDKQIARVRLFFLGFLSGMPDVELGINDIWRQGKEVVGRHDIIPVATEEWIRLENIEFHSCVQQDEYDKSKLIKFKPPDACYFELMRFRVRPPRNRELPLQLKAVMCVTGNKVELRADILVPGFASRKLGRVPCEDVMVRFPIPECWIYLFRVEKHFRYGSVKSAHRRTGKIKGIERFLGTMDTLEPQLMEVTSGQAKYEHQHHAIVWRMPRLPKEGQGAYTTHQLVCRLSLTSYDQIPEKLSEYAYVEFTMPVTQVSHTTARSVSFQNFDGDEPPEKYVKNLSRHEYRVGIEHTQGEGPGAYISATSISTPKKSIPESTPETHDQSGSHHQPAAPSDSDSSD